ncbi:single-stranded DNA-binding protein [Niallia taxi]|uniref:single-stranded DNA-binding protein n=1 Tax=Niallia taxi TaxID=2499688 RepID=UPI003F645A7B
MVNQVTLVGRLTRDPELKLTQAGTSVTNITLAVKRSYRNQAGEYEVDFISCIFWNKAAEHIVHYCHKGLLIAIIGSIQTRNYENQEGKRIYVTEVAAEYFRFLEPKREEQLITI